MGEPLGAFALTLGSGTGRGILPLPDRTVAPEHARITPIPEGGYSLDDLGSESGTFVNGERLHGPHTLQGGDSIRIGGTAILFVVEDGTDAEERGISATQTLLAEELPPSPHPSPTGGTHYVLQYRIGDETRILHLGGKAIRVGRHGDCELCIPEPSLSGTHAVIEHDAHGYFIRDHESTNGVWVNGKRVTEARLHPGTRIRMGRVVMGFKELVLRPNLPGESG